MKAAVVYVSRKGATQKIAEAMAEGLGLKAVKAEDFKSYQENYDIIFVGGAKYFGSLDKNLIAFIRQLDKDRVKMTCVFSTNCTEKDAFRLIKEEVEQAGIPVIEEHYSSFGQFLSLKKGHPDEKEIQGAKDFALQVKELYFSDPVTEPVLDGANKPEEAK